MNIRWLIPLGFISVALFAQSIDAPSGVTIFSTSTLTNVYTASTAVDVQGWDSIGVIASTVNTQALAVANIKPQWSHDNATFVDMNVFITNGVSAYDQPISEYSKLYVIQMTNAAPYGAVCDLYPRQARYFRFLVKSTNVFTTGTLNITIQKLNNGGKP